MSSTFCIWLTGLSGSGKTTQAGLLGQALNERGLRTQVLDSGHFRRTISRDLGFSLEDRRRNMDRLVFVADLLMGHGVVPIIASTAPESSQRKAARDRLGNFFEIHLDCPLETCRQRDPKGLYQRAEAGEINLVAGLDLPYQVPEKPDLIIKTSTDTPLQSLEQILTGLETLRKIPSASEDGGYTPEEMETLEKRLKDLGYL